MPKKKGGKKGAAAAAGAAAPSKSKKVKKKRTPKGGAAKSPPVPTIAKVTKAKNTQLSSGIMLMSRSTLRRHKTRSVQGVKNKNGGKFPTTAPKAKAAPAPVKDGYFYSTEDTPVPLKSTKSKQNPVKVRSTIVPVRPRPALPVPYSAAAPPRPRCRPVLCMCQRTQCQRVACHRRARCSSCSRARTRPSAWCASGR